VAQALGGDLSDVKAQEMEVCDGDVTITLSGQLAHRFPQLAGKRVIACTRREKNLIIATSLL